MPGLILRLSCCLGVSIPRNQGLKNPWKPPRAAAWTPGDHDGWIGC